MDETIFYLLGGALVVSALAVAAVGLRWTDSFPTRQAMFAVTIAFALLVSGTATFAVLSARAEQEHRDEEQAREEARAEELAQKEGEGAAAPAGGQPQGAPAGEEESFDVSSPEDGGLAYEPPALQAPAGTITLVYDNPSPVVHNINLEVEGQTVVEGEDITGASTEITAELAPGEYIYFCSIPGHREGGMEGVLTVE